MRHLTVTSFLLMGLLSGAALLNACGQKGPLVLPDKAKHKTVPAGPATASSSTPTP